MAVVVGVAVYVLRSPGSSLDEVVELAADAGARVLNEPMRAARGGPRVLVFALDGVGHDDLLGAIARGETPNIAAVFGAATGNGSFENAYAVPDVLSVLPSTTLAAWASAFTGQPAGRTGVPGTEFFVREQRRFYAPAPVSVSGLSHMLETYSDDLVGSVLAVPTVYEQADVRSYVALSHIHRGADLLVVPDLGAMADITIAAITGVAPDSEATERDPYGAVDAQSVEVTLDMIAEHGVADLQVIYFPGVDLYTHAADNPILSQPEHVSQVIDPSIGQVLNAYRDAGVLDDTYVMLISDHGHTPVLNDDRHALEAEGDDEPPALIERAGFRMRAMKVELNDDEQDYQATVAYQGAFAYVYLADRSTCVEPGTECDWSRAPRLAEDVLPVVRAFDEANRTGAHVPALRGTLDMILAREPRAPGTDALSFQVWDGAALVPVDEWLAANPRPELLDFARRLDGLGSGPHGHRAGDVLLFARSGDARPIEDRYYFSGPYHSWHGSPSAQDSRIPLVVARRGTSAADIRALVESSIGAQPTQLDITPLILHLLTSREP
ncbi:hypothetical protein BH23GEM10_BH23GEM10_13420 [soil metagenome]